ncbi:hypothetical protein KAT08_04085 [Candidatus Babeliales bacterium]|nr:hypothetical protein [Candidatus Babeliales bacterium]
MKKITILITLLMIFGAFYSVCKPLSLMVKTIEKDLNISTLVYIKINGKAVAKEIRNGAEFFLNISKTPFLKNDVRANSKVEIEARIIERISSKKHFLKISVPGIIAPRHGKITFTINENTLVKIQKSSKGYSVEFITEQFPKK